MKQVFTLIALLFMLSTAHAQAPNAIPYQAAARNSSGAILASTNISVRFTIRDAVASGTILYRETHAVTTSVQGLFSVNVSQGTVVSGSFNGINWGVNHKFMQVELDPAGGSSYIDMGTQQLLSVPYALFSGATRPTISSVGDTMFFGGGVYYIIPGISAANCVVSAGTITSASSVCTGSNISLTSSVAGGVWSSSNPSVAPIVGGNIMVGFSAGTTTVTYTVAAACGTATVTAVVTVNPVPAAGIISGASSVCADQTTTLSSTIAGGTWTSSNTSAATVSSAGVVSGVSAGVTTISYTVTNGCGSATTSRSMTVNPLPFAGTVSGTATVCVGSTTTLTSTGSGGTWSSSHGAIATINPMGVVTGVAAGTATISYKVVNSCGTSTGVNVVTVNPLPIAGTITGADTVMMSGSITLSNTATGGTWSSSTTAVATVGTTGAVNGIIVGSVSISYTVTNSCGTSVTTKGVYVRPLMVGDSYGGGIIAYILQPGDPGYVAGQFRAIIAAPSDQGAIQWGCYGTLLGSTSQTVGSGAANTVSVSASCGAGTAARSCADLVLSGYSDWYLPSKNELDKLRANRATIGGFALGSYWSSSESTVNNALLVNFNTGNALSVAKNESFNVRAVRTISCPELPSSITGTASVCISSTTTLSSATTGGTWSTSAPGIAIVSASGVVTGIAVGTATISYTVTESCGSASATRVVTVNTTPSVAAFTGTASVTAGSTTTLSNATTGGTWSSSATGIATVGSTGVVTGVAAGTATISYAVTNGCGITAATIVVTVNAASITIGATYGGGVIAYILQPGDPGYIAGETHGLIAAPNDQSTGIQWGCFGTSVGGTSLALGTGAANTAIVSAACGAGTAARLCADLVLGGYSDWYLPSHGELFKLYINRSSIGGFTTGDYWSSSEYVANNAWAIGFIFGSAYNFNKNGANYVRAVRTFTCTESAGTIIGTATVCAGSSITLSNATAGGTWSSSATGIATVSASGVVTGIATGTATISYTVTGSCGSASATRVVSVNTTPSVAAFTGTASVTAGSTTTLSNATTGGTWSSSATGIATVGSTGVVTGVAAGTATISYAVTNGCGSTAATIVVTVNAASITIGATYGGGVIAYILQPGDPGYVAGETHGLIAAPSDQSAGIQWWNGSYITSGATGIELGTGMANTNAIVAAQGSGSYAAKLCADLVLNGYSDWYLPNRHELEKLYINRSYIGGFTTGSYWSSSEYGNYAWHVFFDGGSTSFHYKYVILPVRAVRTF